MYFYFQAPLSIATPLDTSQPNGDIILLGICGHKQTYNAGLAVQLASTWLQAQNSSPLSESLKDRLISNIEDLPVKRSSILSTQMIKGK